MFLLQGLANRRWTGAFDIIILHLVETLNETYGTNEALSCLFERNIKR